MTGERAVAQLRHLSDCCWGALQLADCCLKAAQLAGHQHVLCWVYLHDVTEVMGR